eukprot:SAG31_NODE_1405_length_8488_cov_2.786029_12_plen_487_part_00
MCNGASRCTRSSFSQTASSHTVRQKWLPVATYVRSALIPQFEALLDRFVALDVRFRGVCILPLLFIAAPFDPLRNEAAAAADGMSKWFGISEQWETARGVVSEYFLPLLTQPALEVAFEAATAVLAVARALHCGSGSGGGTGGWASKAVRALLRLGARGGEPDALGLALEEAAGGLELVGHHERIGLTVSFLMAARHLPDTKQRLQLICRALQLAVTWASTEPSESFGTSADEQSRNDSSSSEKLIGRTSRSREPELSRSPNVLRAVLEHPSLRIVLSGEGIEQAGPGGLTGLGGSTTFREEIVMAATTAVCRFANSNDRNSLRTQSTTNVGHNSNLEWAQSEAFGWVGPGIVVAECCAGCLLWRCGSSNQGHSGKARVRVSAQQLYLELVALLCATCHPIRATIISDGVPQPRLQALLFSMKAQMGKSASISGLGVADAGIQIRVLWLLAQHLSLRDERESRLLPYSELPSPETLLGQIYRRLLR